MNWLRDRVCGAWKIEESPSNYGGGGEGATRLNPFRAKLSHLHFHPLEVVSRYRDTQLQVAENYSYFSNFTPNICKS